MYDQSRRGRRLGLLLSAWLGVSAVFLPPPSLAAPGCGGAALALLKQSDPNGYAIVQQTGDQGFFEQWLACDTRNYGLGLAVHETSHKLDVARLSDSRRSAFYIKPGEVLRVRNYQLFHRSEIARYIPPAERDEYAQQYLTGASGAQDITMLLEELNAYTQGTITDARLVELMPEGERQSTRDGVATFLYYTALYLKRGREAYPQQWRKLAADPAYVLLIQRLWQRAEEVLQPIMAEPRLGLRDQDILVRVYEPALLDELRQFFRAGGRTFRHNPAILQLALANRGERQEMLTSPEDSRVEPPTETVVEVTYNGQIVTREQLEQLLRERPQLQDDESFMEALRALRAAQRP